MTCLLKVRNLDVVFRSGNGPVWANRSVSFSLHRGESLGLVGESGCGKTVLALALLRLQQPGEILGGEVALDGIDVLSLPEARMRRIRGRHVGLVPQDHGSALNPLQTVEAHLVETIAARDGWDAPWRRLWDRGSERRRAARAEAAAALRAVGLPWPERLLRCFPHELSGGMRQRVLVALALLMKPSLLICDEVTTALDASVKARILALLADVKRHTSLLFISHDVAAVRRLCDRVAVMYAGAVVEVSPMADLFADALHPYARALIASQRFPRGEPLCPIPGEVPDLVGLPNGCAFHPRCRAALPVCAVRGPVGFRVGERWVACHLYADRSTRPN